jgi:hypothetical protein
MSYPSALVTRRWQQRSIRLADDRRQGGVLQLCAAVWPPSRADVAPAPCQLSAGHHGRHLHIPAGFTASVEW